MFSEMPVDNILVTQRMLGNPGQLPDLVKKIRDGATADIPPIVLQETDDNFLQCIDGHHRLVAFYLAGEEVLQQEHFIYALGGLRRHTFGNVETLADWVAEYERTHPFTEPLCQSNK
jgi:hypothetical protein